ncbi:hypothetical protein CBQ26_18535 [Deinococcus indicus]|uniref:Peptidase M41 FtsH extracellular domain-containing protein n=1 Tax=Deinococcus indicus TaxID=223556 RepID=A0A246BEQ5_9DEIO|nr:hypothetical protein CBQ26_18535 [Deinococcus indicus]GHG35440.1 hypothetical protein GCM10017784_31800 [Deinococcus indicus]
MVAGVLALLWFAGLGGLGWRALGGAGSSVSGAAFRELVAAGRVERVVMRDGGNVQAWLRGGQQVRVRLSDRAVTPDSALTAQLEARNVNLRFERRSPWLGVALNVLPVALFLALWVGVPLGLLALGVAWRRGRRAARVNVAEG